MEERVRLRVMGISYSPLQSGAFALILAQENGPYRIPVVIGAAEAQSIAIKIEDVIPPRPMTHDLFCSFAHAFGVTLKDVFIYKFEDGIFSSELTFSDGERQVVLDSRTSDAIAIAIRTQAPIYTTMAIVKETGTIFNDQDDDDGSDISGGQDKKTEEPGRQEPKLENYAIEELERTLSRLIDEENYEEAARVNEILNRKKSQAGNPEKQ